VTVQVADKDASVAWELLRSFREMLRAPTSVERDVCREQLQEGISHGGLPGRGEREPRTTNVADHRLDLDRLAIGVRVIPFAEEQSTARGGRQAAQ
jgi:hypothetical protein